jgi:hypothetical protein
MSGSSFASPVSSEIVRAGPCWPCWPVALSRSDRSGYDISVTTICSNSYWRFISGFSLIGSNQGRPGQIGQFMQFVQRRINTDDCASR